MNIMYVHMLLYSTFSAALLLFEAFIREAFPFNNFLVYRYINVFLEARGTGGGVGGGELCGRREIIL
jgi:hypothetical protein